IGLLPQRVRDQVAQDLSQEHITVLDAFVSFATDRAKKTSERRWSERAVLAQVLFLAAPESLSKELETNLDGILDNQEPNTSSLSLAFNFVEGNINKPLWSAEELGLSLASFCEQVAGEATTSGAIYLHGLARRPDLPYIARDLSFRFADAHFGPV